MLIVYVQDFRFYINLTKDDIASIPEYFDILTSNVVGWTQNGWGGYMKISRSGQSFELSNLRRTRAEAEADMAPILAFLDKRNFTYTLKKQDSWYNYIQEVMAPHETHVGLWSWNTASRLLPKSVFERSRDKVKDTFRRMYDDKLFLWIMLVTPTQFPHTTSSSLHPSWKDAIMSVRVGDRWDQFFDKQSEELYRKHYIKTHDGSTGLRDLATGMGGSINEADIWEEDHADLFWGKENYERLLKIKNRVDPENLLTNYHAVGWDSKDARYQCYPKQDPNSV
jgi:berberine-like enzyme